MTTKTKSQAAKKAERYVKLSIALEETPLYVRAVALRYLGRYCYLAHHDPAFLEQVQVESYVSEWSDSERTLSGEKELKLFLAWLAKYKGYILLNTSPEIGPIELGD